MINIGSPVIVRLHTSLAEPRCARLADVLIVVSDSGRPEERCADLLARHPGLTLAVVGSPIAGIVAAVRGGLVLTIDGGQRSTIPPDILLASLGKDLYARWTAGCDLEELSTARVVVSRRGDIQLIGLPGHLPGAG